MDKPFNAFQINIHFRSYLFLTLLWHLPSHMDKVATISINAKMIVFKTATLLCLVLRVIVVVLSQLYQSMSKLASLFVGTVAIFHKLFAQLGF